MSALICESVPYARDLPRRFYRPGMWESECQQRQPPRESGGAKRVGVPAWALAKAVLRKKACGPLGPLQPSLFRVNSDPPTETQGHMH